jgi:hypothetical protein
MEFGLWDIIWMHALQCVGTEQILCRSVTQDVRETFIRISGAAARVGFPDTFGGGFDQPPKPCFALSQGFT